MVWMAGMGSRPARRDQGLRAAGQQPPRPHPATTINPLTQATQVQDFFGVNLDQGLSQEQVDNARRLHGRNELAAEPGEPVWVVRARGWSMGVCCGGRGRDARVADVDVGSRGLQGCSDWGWVLVARDPDGIVCQDVRPSRGGLAHATLSSTLSHFPSCQANHCGFWC